jgi:hypothetical protein
MSVHEAKRRISSSEFSQWVAYWRLEPFGDRRADYQIAHLLAGAASLMGAKRVQIEDFLPYWPSTPRPQRSVSAMADTFRVFARVHNRIADGDHSEP